MSYRVVISARAHEDLEDACSWWAEHRSAEQAERWYNGIGAAIRSLRRNPHRCALAQENDAFPYEIRQLHYGVGKRPTHRVVFTIRPDMVFVLRVRHLAQDELSPDDV